MNNRPVESSPNANRQAEDNPKGTQIQDPNTHHQDTGPNPDRRRRPMETLEAGVARTALPTIADISTGSFTESIQELMQNARMAGASRIDIDVYGDTVTVTDNGHGILHPEALLTYGMSRWHAPGPETPSGMGLFSLADNTIVITTRAGIPSPGDPWTTTLTPRHFRGETKARRLPCEHAPSPHGTSVSFTADGVKTWALEALGLYFPIPVHVCGESVPQTPVLDGADEIVEWMGLRIGLFDDLPNAETQSKLCWHGAMSYLPVTTTRGSGHAMVDVVNCSYLRMSRPGFDLVVEHPFSRRLTEMIETRLQARGAQRLASV